MQSCVLPCFHVCVRYQHGESGALPGDVIPQPVCSGDISGSKRQPGAKGRVWEERKGEETREEPHQLLSLILTNTAIDYVLILQLGQKYCSLARSLSYSAYIVSFGSHPWREPVGDSFHLFCSCIYQAHVEIRTDMCKESACVCSALLGLLGQFQPQKAAF